MADPAELVTLKLIFWHKDKKPGDLVQVRRDEVRSWYGFAELVDDVEPVKADESADTGAQKTPDKADTNTADSTGSTDDKTADGKGDQATADTPATPAVPAKTTRAKQA